MTNIINQEVITALGIVLGGIALFIYGIDQMSDGLKSMAGNRIREYIEKYTRNLFMAVTVGTIITATLFSSGVGIFFGIYPAKKAARFSPIEALRRN